MGSREDATGRAGHVRGLTPDLSDSDDVLSLFALVRLVDRLVPLFLVGRRVLGFCLFALALGRGLFGFAHARAVPSMTHAKPAGRLSPVSAPLDRLGRPLRDLRISITDRCNFRCVYCMPKEVFGRDYEFLPRAQLLDYEEIARLAGAFVANGVRKIRITGGEPLVRRHVERLVELLAALDVDLTLTTNGSLLPQKAQALADAGLARVTVSLDSLDDATFRAMNDIDFPVQRVLEGIDA